MPQLGGNQMQQRQTEPEDMCIMLVGQKMEIWHHMEHHCWCLQQGGNNFQVYITDARGKEQLVMINEFMTTHQERLGHGEEGKQKP